MEKIKWLGVGVFLTLILVLMIKKAPEKGQPLQMDIEDKDAIIAIPTPYPTIDYQEQYFKKVFIDGCMESGDASPRFCSCAYNEIRKDYSISALSNLIDNNGMTDEWINKYVNICL